MAGYSRFESSSSNLQELGFTGSYPNGQRSNYSNATLDRSGSFREGIESRVLGSGPSTPRGSALSDMALLSHCLLLDPITMGDQKYTRSGELRRALGISLGNAAEDNSFGAAHSKPPPPLATGELKRFKASVSEATLKARARIKKLNESLLKLNKYCETLNLKKQQRNEMLVTERLGGSNFMKMGIHINRNASDLGTQRLEDRTKNIVLNKRVRSSAAELRADGRSNTLPRQLLVMGKDRDMLRECGEASDLPVEKVQRMPAGGDGWDRKMKRKRSMGSVFARSTDSDGEVKRIMHHKFNNEPGLQSCDAQGFSTGSFNGNSGINKLDTSSLSASSNPRSIRKKESEKVSLTREFADGMNKERVVAKANNKLNILEDNHFSGPSLVIKGKASRAPRTGSGMVANSSPNFSHTFGAPNGWEQTPNVKKVGSIGGTINRERSTPAGSSSPPMAQWVGQRPQKISRTRRANVVSPVLNHDEVQMSSDGGHPSEFLVRLNTTGSNGSLFAKDAANGNHLVKVKHENVSSPARLSESEEFDAGANHEGRLKEKGMGSVGVEEISQNHIVGPVVLTKKNKILNEEETSDGLRKQGRIGRGALSSRASISPVREKLESPASTKPARSTRPVSDKNGSKSGRPLKKILDRKAFTRVQTATCGSPDFTGETDDDREEILAAANFARNASFAFADLSCSNSFWKNIEPVFASICIEDSSCLKQQLKSAEELYESLFEIFGHGNNTLGDLVHQEDFQPQLISEASERSLQDHVWPNKQLTISLVDQGMENGKSCGNLEKRNQATPLYRRVLSVLILEDEYEEIEENNGGRNISFQNWRDRSPGDTCLPLDFEPRKSDRTELDYDSMLGFQTKKQSYVDGVPCNGNATINRAASFHIQLCNDDSFQGAQGFMSSKVGMFPGHSGNNDGKLVVQTNASGICALDCNYVQSLEERLLMELQSIGLYPEIVPDLADGEDEAINQDIIELQKGLHQQMGKKKAQLKKIIKEVDESKEVEVGGLEQVAMNRLVELAYKKLLATRGSCASKFGVPKVSKQVALAFMNRTLARCRKFEDAGQSCFNEPALRDIILSAPPCGNQTESISGFGLAVKSNMHRGASNSQHDPGPLLNKGKKKELLLDDVGGNASFIATSSLGNAMLAGTKGKRSERDRDKDTVAKNSVIKAGRALQANVKVDRKAKSKPKQKTAQLSTSGDGISNKFKEASSNEKREVGLNSYGYNPPDSSKESRGATDITDLQDLSLELGITSDIGSHQDLSNLFNFDEDSLPENDLMGLDLPLDGLEIPMDDLSELNMLL
ncbi:uncharacterized protein LOC110668421 isoform X2 [Hevea brasiliensis]|uniref:uncharacterized protein LOC110668421 isoform X2 n=1 Tax=Hevea brasiliensis TaxID=3981 RepID=UPI0025D65B4D|nr:uncharacterized protein LOC110668421 isoform X2 [Hevea brasiliensis]